jgi:hypothetical protein
MPRACTRIPPRATGQALTVARGAGRRLDDTAGDVAFSESEQSKNEASGMVPLYAARVQDLGPGDVVVVECGACGHTTAIPPIGLVHGLRLAPTERVLDLAPRLRCRECDARGKAVVSIRWALVHGYLSP